jgi:hypothetical protein
MRPAATSAIPLRVELSMTADIPDGQPLPPPSDCGVVWHVVRRDDSHTLWRRIFLSLPSATDFIRDVIYREIGGAASTLLSPPRRPS